MIYREIGKIIEACKMLQIGSVDGIQWIGVPGAMYSLIGLPRIDTFSQAMQLLGIEVYKQDDIICTEINQETEDAIHSALAQSDHGVYLHNLWGVDGYTVCTLDDGGVTILPMEMLKPVKKFYDGILTQGSTKKGWRMDIPILISHGYVPRAVIWPRGEANVVAALSDVARVIDLLRQCGASLDPLSAGSDESDDDY